MERWSLLHGRLERVLWVLAHRRGVADVRVSGVRERWWAWWDRTHGDGADEYRRANGLYGA